MSFLSRRLLPVVVVSNLIASLALAHPGHDGHEGGGEFTWDFSHLTAHPLATLALLAIAGAAASVIAGRVGARMANARVDRSRGNR
ncbi:MAG: hypothetical protein LW690_07310 [Opitutaceae bacterium]|jgi:hypothetical protein|nr:hypothetical protein [Opitutaceae bacterium]